jgi:hypothetical protein
MHLAPARRGDISTDAGTARAGILHRWMLDMRPESMVMMVLVVTSVTLSDGQGCRLLMFVDAVIARANLLWQSRRSSIPHVVINAPADLMPFSRR